MKQSLALIFFLSGSAGLMYQVAWQRILSTHYGVGAIATTMIISVFLLGLGIGAVLGGRLAERVQRPILAYVVVEIVLGVFGAASLSLLGAIGEATAGQAYPVVLLCTTAFLAVPTMLMGATLPLLTKAMAQLDANFLRVVGSLYSVNTFGAAAGSLFASYIVISFWGLDGAVYLAAGTNGVLALWASRVARQLHVGVSAEAADPDTRTDYGSLGRLAYPLVFLTGLLAIGYEIAWLRMHAVLLKSSPYVFSTVLSVYLVGIALGSLFVQRWMARRPNADMRSAFFTTQALVGVFVVVSIGGYYWLTAHTPLSGLTHSSFHRLLHPEFVPFDAESMRTVFRSVFSWVDVLFWPCVFMLVPSALMGAAFPLVTSLALADRRREGGTVGTVYFWNVTGNVLGGIGTGFVLLPYLGTANSMLCFAVVNTALFALNSAYSPRFRAIGIAAVLVVGGVFFPRGDALYRVMHPTTGDQLEQRVSEGVDTTVVSEHDETTLRVFIGGLQHGGRPEPSFYFEAATAASLVPKARETLVIGFGTGAIVESLIGMREVERVTLVELSSGLLEHLGGIPFIRPILDDAKLTIVIDDGRRFLRRENRKFDLVLTDPLRTTTASAGNLYSVEFLELIRSRLTERGALMMWMDELNVVPRSVASVFDHVRLVPLHAGKTAFCVASNAPLDWNDERLRMLVDQLPQNVRLGVKALCARGFADAEDRAAILKRTDGLPVNEDARPRTEFYLGLPDAK
jgi:spermidine synthase